MIGHAFLQGEWQRAVEYLFTPREGDRGEIGQCIVYDVYTSIVCMMYRVCMMRVACVHMCMHVYAMYH